MATELVDDRRSAATELPQAPSRFKPVHLLAAWGVIPMGLQSAVNTDPWPKDIVDRPYFTVGMCGPGTEFACIDPRVPEPVGPRSAHISPEGKLIAPDGLPDQTRTDSSTGTGP